MANVTYTVKKGDTLSEIAVTYKSTIGDSLTLNERIKKLVALNDIEDPDFIVIGQVLILSGTGTTSKSTTTSRATIKQFGLQSNTERTVYATWTWTKDNTKEYRVLWYYATGDGIWFVGDDSTVTEKQCTYNAPTNATKVKFKVKPISKTRKVNKKETSYWTANWSTEKIYNFSSNPPLTPPVPTVEIVDYTLTAELDNLDVNGTEIQFQIVKNDSSVFNTGISKIKTSHASYSCKVTAGNEYKVRCRAKRNDEYSDWSDYSSNEGTSPAASKGILKIKALSTTSVSIDWANVKTATSYELEYTTKKMYFDSSDEVRSMTVGSVVGHAEVTGLESGQEWFFRVRSVNDNGKSAWTNIDSIILGKKPIAPTTWMSTSTALVGEFLTLYWVHNSEDGSSQTFAELELYINGTKETYTIKNSTDEDEKDKTSSRIIDTSGYTEGTTIQWRVRTAGITNEYGDWSAQRTVNVYAPPTVEMEITNSEGTSIETLTSFPFYISALAGPNTQLPIGYYVVVTSNEKYETVDSVGNSKIVNAGESVYSNFFDISDELLVELSAGNIDLENNITYTVTCTVSMNSGLTAESSMSFNVAWTDDEYEPDAEIGFDKDTLVTYIMPYCYDKNVNLSVYRREFDGRFTKLAEGINNAKNTFITDPHPALDYARYRIVATSIDTGAVSYTDLPGYPIGESAVVIQWDEQWSNFDITEDELEQPPWSGSMIKLPYNIDVSDKNSKDVSLVNYIGRQHPVSYYGTHLGETSTWKVAIPKSDKETLYALRRLKIWMGDVYVREPSGSGYWANISVSFSQTHCDLTIPVSFSVTRVEGGA